MLFYWDNNNRFQNKPSKKSTQTISKKFIIDLVGYQILKKSPLKLTGYETFSANQT